MEQRPPGASAWEYKLVEMGNPLQEGVEARANAFGKLGWELATVDAGVWVFKRPVQADSPDEPLKALVEATVPLVAAEPAPQAGGQQSPVPGLLSEPTA